MKGKYVDHKTYKVSKFVGVGSTSQSAKMSLKVFLPVPVKTCSVKCSLLALLAYAITKMHECPMSNIHTDLNVRSNI